MTKRFASPFDAIPKQTKVARITSSDDIPSRPQELLLLPKPTIIDLIPPRERTKHTYLRGASLGAVAYNLINYDILNTANDINSPHMHFAEGPNRYQYANTVAESIARGEGYSRIQLKPEMLAYLAQIAGQLIATTPGIIFALHPDLNDYVLRPSDRGAREGVIWDGAVTLDMIDAHSREALKRLID